jgi:hypothetical protein
VIECESYYLCYTSMEKRLTTLSHPHPQLYISGKNFTIQKVANRSNNNHTDLPGDFFELFDGAFVQSEFHKRHMLKTQGEGDDDGGVENETGYIVIPNGLTLLPEQNANAGSTKNNSVFIYGSAPNRGLKEVRNID